MNVSRISKMSETSLLIVAVWFNSLLALSHSGRIINDTQMKSIDYRISHFTIDTDSGGDNAENGDAQFGIDSEEHDHIVQHLEMQKHHELLEDIREDILGNSLPEKGLPKFGEPLHNVTVLVGREAILQCAIDNLQTYKIAWLRVDTQTILTIQNHVITKNHRMSVNHAEKRAWILTIRDVKESDRGWYMCQINTDPMKSQVGYLDVVVSPDILDYPTSSDMVVREGSNVTLKCAATGSPTPTITWRREGGEPVPVPSGTEVIAYHGSHLTIAKVNRLNMGAYLCIASNGIPPSVSKRIMLIVHFPPMIWIQNQLVGVAVGNTVSLECQSEAYPRSINYWMKNDTIIVPGKRFIPEKFENGYKIAMRLTIKDIDISELGTYSCVSKNSLGDTDGAIKLYHIPKAATVTTMSPTVSLNTETVVFFKYENDQHYNSNLYRKWKTETPLTTVNNIYIGATSSLWNLQGFKTGQEHPNAAFDHMNNQRQNKPKSMHDDDNSLLRNSDNKPDGQNKIHFSHSVLIVSLGLALTIARFEV